jgi:hypothetical protein
MVDPIIPRPKVAAFAELMEKALRENDYKGGWDRCKPKWLLARACEELAELVDTLKPKERGPWDTNLLLAKHHLALAAHMLNAIGAYTKLEGADAAAGEAADVANFLLMFVDRLKQLPKELEDDERAAS